MSKKKTSKFGAFVLCALALVLGLLGGFSVFTYISLPKTEELVISSDVYYSKNDKIT